MSPREARAHLFVADLDTPEIESTDRHHLDRVLRLRPGDPVTICDGAGRWRWCRWAASPQRPEPWGEVRSDPRPSPEVAVAFAPVKGDRPEWAVQKLTEVGVDRIVVFTAARSVVRWDGERSVRAVERLRRVAREAAMQSRRTWLPAIETPTTFAEVAARTGSALAEPGGKAPWWPAGPVLVGPEGGWAPEELARDLPRMALGAHVLRTETAVVAAGVLLTYLRAESGAAG
ncbi:MAG: RsmE family RNA methyltransferase [Acidimicrobiales bacterium]